MVLDEDEKVWPRAIYDALRRAQVSMAAHVPDAGHAWLIDALEADPAVEVVVLTTEEEGVAFAAGAWLGGRRAVLLVQSSGVGNTINMLSLMEICRFPFLAIVTMRGEWAEFNHWQIPMGRATVPVLEAMGVTCVRLDDADDAEQTIASAALMAFESDQRVAVVLGQRLIGAKRFTEERP